MSCSSDLAPFIRLLPRAETAVVDAYLGPVLHGYLRGVRDALGGGRLHVMTSAGGLARPEDFRPKDSLLSGPAGGVAGAALAGRRSGMERVIAFDMGGTSTDVARWAGDFEYVWEHEVGGAHLVAPALAIESVAAGGGSVCAFDAQGLRVGPESAGASPGPACYGAGGPLTVTDVNLLLGRLDPARFGIPVDPAPAEAALEALRRELRERTGEDAGREPLLAGFLEIADERMADAIRGISLRRGYDPAEHALVAFGGAGGQHACGVAARLGIRHVLVPPDAGLLSALGIGHAPLERFAERQVLRPLDEAGPRRRRVDGGDGRRGRRRRRARGRPPGRGRGPPPHRGAPLRRPGCHARGGVEPRASTSATPSRSATPPSTATAPSAARWSWSRCAWSPPPAPRKRTLRPRPPRTRRSRTAAPAPGWAAPGATRRSSTARACAPARASPAPPWWWSATAPPSWRRAGTRRPTGRGGW